MTRPLASADADQRPNPDQQVAAIELRDVTRRFVTSSGPGRRRRQTIHALCDISLTIPGGSRFGIVGESGSGKTTLLRIIAGLDTPTAGQVLFDDVEVAGPGIRPRPAGQRGLQMVFQDPASSLNPRMRVGSIIAEPLRVLRLQDIGQRVTTVLTEVGLTAADAQKYPHQFSGGQRQRISLARAIAPRPSTLLADEAVSALDVSVRTQILDLIDELARTQQFSLVMVSHDLSVVQRLCEHIAVLQQGRIVESGPVSDVYQNPQHPYTRSLLQAIPSLEDSLAAAAQRRDSAAE